MPEQIDLHFFIPAIYQFSYFLCKQIIVTSAWTQAYLKFKHLDRN